MQEGKNNKKTSPGQEKTCCHEALISLDLVGTKLYCFRARVHCFYCLYNYHFLSQTCETFQRASQQPGKKKTRSDCLGQVLVNFALGQMKMEVWWSGGQVNLVSVVLLVNKEQTLHTGFQIFFLVLHPRNSSFG